MKIFFSLHPTQPILASVGDDQQLLIWNSEANCILGQKYLKQRATCCKFSPDGDILVIGFQNGQITLIDMQVI